MRVLTDHVYPDEPCWGLYEGPENRVVNPNGGMERRWVQKVWVIRNDRKACYETDIGPASDYPDATPTAYASVGTDSVAQLQWLAERDRYNDKWAKYREELRGESTLIKDILQQEETLMEVRKNRSHFGPGANIQRIDFPREAIHRRAKEEKSARERRN